MVKYISLIYSKYSIYFKLFYKIGEGRISMGLNRGLASVLSDSITLKISARAKGLKKQGVDIISFSAGEPDFPTPDFVKEAAKEAIDDNFTRYTPAAGILPLREAAANYIGKSTGVKYSPEQVLVSSGAKQAIFNILVATLTPTDKVIIPRPYWVSYPEMVRIAGGEPVFWDINFFSSCDRLNLSQLEHLLDNGASVLLLNSPNNPAGYVLTDEEVLSLARLLEKHNITVISDEIYDRIIFDGRHHISIAKYLLDRTVVVNGVSKSFSMTGWRIGFAAGPAEIISLAAKVQAHTASNPCSISQKAALAAITGPSDTVNTMRDAFGRRRDIAVSTLGEIEGMALTIPEGAFYLLPDVRAFLNKNAGSKKIATSFDLCEYLLDEALVACVPADAFGLPGFIRLSFATGEREIISGIARMKAALLRLK